MTQLLIPMVQTVLQTIEILQLLYDKVVEVPGVRVVQFPKRRLWMRQSCSHSSCSLRKSSRSQRSSTFLS